MLQEREAWMECRRSFEILRVVDPAYASAQIEREEGFTTVASGTPLAGRGFDLIVVPESIRREHKRWVEDMLLTRLNPGGKLIVVDDSH